MSQARIRFPAPSDPERLKDALTIPGVRFSDRYSSLYCSLDAAPAVERALGVAESSRAREAAYSLAQLPASVRGWTGLRPFQQQDALLLAQGLKDLEWAPTGSGKTRIVLAALALSGARKVLVFTRALGRLSWARDAVHVGDFSVVLVYGRGPNKSATASAQRANKNLDTFRAQGVSVSAVADLPGALGAATTGALIVVVPWEVLDDPRSETGARLGPAEGHRAKELLAQRWDAVVFDEHHKTKTWTTVRARVAQALSKSAGRVIGVTATPQPNERVDLQTQLSHVAPDSWTGFVDVAPLGLPRNLKPQFSVRYCVGPRSQVLMANGSYKRIGQIRAGDQVMGWTRGASGRYRTLSPTTVERTWVLQAPRVRVHLRSGRQLICTADHLWLTKYGGKRDAEYLPLIGAGPRRERYLMRVAHAPAAPLRETAAYMHGYLRGMIDGDGHVIISSRQSYQSVIASNDAPVIDRVLRYSAALGLPTPTRAPHSGSSCELVRWCKKSVYLYFKRPYRTSAEFKRGWLAGMYDAEATGRSFSQYRKVNRSKHTRIRRYLAAFGFKVSWNETSVRVRGGLPELLRLFGLLKIALDRKIAWVHRYTPGRMRPVRDDVVSITPASRGTVVALKTASGNYIVDGYGSKNCHGQVGRWGEWDASGPHKPSECYECAQNREARSLELRERLLWFAAVHTREELRAELPALTRMLHTVGADAAVRGIARAARATEKNAYEANLRIANDAKIPAAAELAIDCLNGLGKVVIAVNRNAAVAKAKAAIEKGLKGYRRLREKLAFFEVAVEDAGERAFQCERYQAQAAPALLITTIGKVSESINLHTTTDALIVSPPDTYLEVVQLEGRFQRKGGVGCCAHYFFAEGTTDEARQRALYEKIATVQEAGADTLGEKFSLGAAKLDAQVQAEIAAWLAEQGEALGGLSTDE